MSVTEFTSDEQQALEQKWTITRFIYFPAGLIGLWGLTAPWPSDHWGWLVFWTIYTGYVLFCWTSCFHETAHQTLSGSRSVSIWLGRVLGTINLTPYTAYRESHIRHHAYLNKPHDWELWPYSDPNRSMAFRRGFVWLDLVLGCITAPYIYGRIYFHKSSPIKSLKLRAAIRHEYLAILAFWTALLSGVAYFGVWSQFVTVWVGPHLVAGFMQSARKLTEHLGMASYDPILGTRTVVGTGMWTRFCTFLNFDIFIHGAHHRHPRISHHLLKQTMQDYIRQNPDYQLPIYPSYWRATLSMIPNLLTNPGVGINVGAPAHAQEKNPHVENFVQDVAAEVLADVDSVPIGPSHSR